MSAKSRGEMWGRPLTGLLLTLLLAWVWQLIGQTQAATVTRINRDYCKRLMVVLPKQKHPEQWHNQKNETYHILYGDVSVQLDGKETVHKANDVITIPHGIRHSFWTKNGAVIEEVSSSYTSDDSFYTDESILANKNRKTFVTY